MAPLTSLFSEPEAMRMESLAPSTEYVAVVPLFESPSDVALEALFVEPHPVNRPTIKAMTPAAAPSLRAFILCWPSVHIAPKTVQRTRKTFPNALKTCSVMCD